MQQIKRKWITNKKGRAFDLDGYSTQKVAYQYDEDYSSPKNTGV